MDEFTRSETTFDLAALCDLTVSLVEIRARDCPHVAVENIGPEILAKLIRVVTSGGAEHG